MGLHRRLHLSEMASEGGGGGHGGRRSRTDSGTRSSEKTDGEASEAGKEHGRRTWVPAWWSMEKGLVRRGRARSGEGAEVQGTAPVDVDKAKDWLAKGVQPTETVKSLLVQAGAMEKSAKLSPSKTKTKKKK